MTLKYIINKSTTRCLYNVNIFKNNLLFGNVNFQIYNTTAYLNNIEVKEKKRGYGSYILINFENYVKYNYNINKIDLLAWQPSNDNNVLNFFEMHGYYHLNPNENPEIYDDSIIIYDLYKLTKKIELK